MHDHLVEFYESDSALVELVGEFVSPRLQAGSPVVVVATAAHRSALADALAGLGIDVAAARRKQWLVELDAAQALERFMVDGVPDPVRFGRLVGGLIGRASGASPELRVYGELVSLLWDRGQRSAALQLEALWNRLLARQRFSLLCTYPLASADFGPNTAPFRSICSSHSAVRLRFDALPAGPIPLRPVPPMGIAARLPDLASELEALKDVI